MSSISTLRGTAFWVREFADGCQSCCCPHLIPAPLEETRSAYLASTTVDGRLSGRCSSCPFSASLCSYLPSAIQAVILLWQRCATLYVNGCNAIVVDLRIVNTADRLIPPKRSGNSPYRDVVVFRKHAPEARRSRSFSVTQPAAWGCESKIAPRSVLST